MKYISWSIGHLFHTLTVSMIDILKQFGDKVRERRKNQKLSQEELAYQMDVDVRSVVAIENGKRNPTLKTIHKLCQVLKIKSSTVLPF